jgi:hypothetical protein
MSIRLDPRRVSTLKQLAADAGVRPGDLVRQWVEERIDAGRGGRPVDASPAAAPANLASELRQLAARVAALEAAAGAKAPKAPKAAAPAAEPTTVAADEPRADSARPSRRNAVSAAPTTERVALHDEMIEVLRERGPMTAAELAGAIVERGRYAPPRSGKPLDAAMVSQRVSNPTYRSRFSRADGRIALAE